MIAEFIQKLKILKKETDEIHINVKIADLIIDLEGKLDEKKIDISRTILKCPICSAKYRKNEIDFECPYCNHEIYIEELLHKEEKTSEENSQKCFMGNCIHLDPEDDDYCKDLEAQRGKWGKCHEFKEKDSGDISRNQIIISKEDWEFVYEYAKLGIYEECHDDGNYLDNDCYKARMERLEKASEGENSETDNNQKGELIKVEDLVNKKELTEKFFGYLNYFFEHYTKGDEGIFEYWEKVKNHYEKEASEGEQSEKDREISSTPDVIQQKVKGILISDSKLSEPNWATPEYISMEEHNFKQKELIMKIYDDLRKAHDHLLERNEDEHYYGTIAHWQLLYLIKKWEKELK